MAKSEIKREVVIRAASGMCECTGQCGHTHQWNDTVPPGRCRATLGQLIRRKLDYPSCWRLAPTFSGELAFAELFSKKDIEVKLVVVVPKVKEAKPLAFCERCAKLAGEKDAVRVMQ